VGARPGLSGHRVGECLQLIDGTEDWRHFAM
jgi:hypothetical protein